MPVEPACPVLFGREGGRVSAGTHEERIAPLARLLPELASGAVSSAADPGQERFSLFDSVATFLANTARERPLVVVLDDLHAADLATNWSSASVARSAA